MRSNSFYLSGRFTVVLVALLLFVGVTTMNAQNFSYSKRFYFHLNKYDIDESLGDNRNTVDSILYKLRDLKRMGASDIKLHITSFASLEASDSYNYKLAANRTNSLTNFLQKFTLVNGVPFVSEPNVFDWETLIRMTRESDCPMKDAALRIMTTTAEHSANGENIRKQQLQQLADGAVYNYMRVNIFPLMRNSALTLTANVPVAEEPKAAEPEPAPVMPKERKKLHVALSTNGLFDLGMIPNIGVSVYLGKQFSVGANWMYSWWKHDNSSWYWRAYGGDVHADYWLSDKQLWQGHRIGVYAQMATFDFEWNKEGYQMPKWSYGGGLQYGYTMSLSKAFGLDFGLGVGYLHGKIYTYDPSHIVDKYLYKETKSVNWIGPTKINVSLVWKLDL